MDREFHDDYMSPECQGVRLVCKRCGVFRALCPEEVERVMMDMDDDMPFACERVKRSCFQADTPKQDPLMAAFQRLCERYVTGLLARWTAPAVTDTTPPRSGVKAPAALIRVEGVSFGPHMLYAPLVASRWRGEELDFDEIARNLDLQPADAGDQCVRRLHPPTPTVFGGFGGPPS